MLCAVYRSLSWPRQPAQLRAGITSIMTLLMNAETRGTVASCTMLEAQQDQGHALVHPPLGGRKNARRAFTNSVNYDTVWCVCVPSCTDAALTGATMHCSRVASVARRAHVLQEWAHAAPRPRCAARLTEPQTPAITCMGCQAVPRSPPPFSDHPTLGCCCCLLLWPRREAPALRKTRNQL